MQQFGVKPVALGLEFGRVAADDDDMPDGFQILPHGFEFSQKGGVDNDGDGLGVVGHVGNLSAGEQRGNGGAHSTQFQDRKIGHHRRRDGRGPQKNAVAFANAQLAQRVPEFAGLGGELGVGDALVFKEKSCAFPPAASHTLVEQFFSGVKPFGVGSELRELVYARRPQLTRRQVIGHIDLVSDLRL